MTHGRKLMRSFLWGGIHGSIKPLFERGDLADALV